MINLAEFKVYSVQIQQLGQEFDARIAATLEGLSKAAAIKMVNNLSDEYYEQMEEILDTALEESATNAVSYHSPEIENPEELAKDILKKVKGQKYYGLTHAARLVINKKRLERNITRTGQILDKEGVPSKLAGVFTQSVPFGAQVSVDRRLLQATIEQIEHEAVQSIAKKEDIPLIKWRTAGKHAKPDICDDLAAYVDPQVVAYMGAKGIAMEAKGVYFRDNLPSVPHPFCQCEFELAREVTGPTGTRIKRAARKLRQIMNRIRRR